MTDKDTEERLEELRKEESTGNRIDRDNPQNQPDFVDAIADALDDAKNGDASETITGYDPSIAALLQALEDEGRLEDVLEQLQAAYDGDSGITKASRSGVMRLAVRVGLQEGTDGTMDDLREAISRQQTPTV